MSVMQFERDGRRLLADLADPLPIAIPLDFGGPQPGFMAAPRATAQALSLPSFRGDTRTGGSCNCEQLTLVPHCNGTHTECVGHLTDERVSVAETLRGGLSLALLVSVRPLRPGAVGETTEPPPEAGDRVISAQALRQALAQHPELKPQALVVRTLPNGLERLSHAYSGPAPAPFLTREAAELLVARDILHLVLDVPSADRARDQGRLTAHRVFFGLPPASRRAAEARRAGATITELAFVAPTIRDGYYLLDLQIPAFMSDAAPSRPVLYPVRFA